MTEAVRDYPEEDGEMDLLATAGMSDTMHCWQCPPGTWEVAAVEEACPAAIHAVAACRIRRF